VRLAPGTATPPRTLSTALGDDVDVPDPTLTVHLQFRRFAACPICHLHLRSFVRRHDEIRAAGVREVVVFHSKAHELRPLVQDYPFAAIADPDKRLYVEFGVESGRRALLDPRTWAAIARTVPCDLVTGIRPRSRPTWFRAPGGRLGLPADFLIASDGRVTACRYGAHADDQWSVDEVIALAGAQTR
jgi:peroxiredoxin